MASRPSQDRPCPSQNGPGPHPQDRYDLRILLAIRQIMRAVAVQSRRLAAVHQVTGPQLACLIAAADEGSATATGIARQVHLSPSTVVGILDRLEGKGLVRRERGRDDRRVVHVSATDLGRSVAANIPFPLQNALSKALHPLPENEQAGIAAWLEHLVSFMGVQHMETGPAIELGATNGALNSEPSAQSHPD